MSTLKWPCRATSCTPGRPARPCVRWCPGCRILRSGVAHLPLIAFSHVTRHGHCLSFFPLPITETLENDFVARRVLPRGTPVLVGAASRCLISLTASLTVRASSSDPRSTMPKPAPRSWPGTGPAWSWAFVPPFADRRGGPRSEDVAGVDELGLVLLGDGVEQLLAGRRLLGRHHRSDRERAQRVSHRQRALGGVLAAGEREHVRAALALAIDVDAADLVHQRIHQGADPVRVGAEDARPAARARR